MIQVIRIGFLTDLSHLVKNSSNAGLRVNTDHMQPGFRFSTTEMAESEDYNPVTDPWRLTPVNSYD